MGKTIGIALSGGGARGIAHLGVLKALDKMGIKPSIISGTSAGAIAGAFYAANYTIGEIVEIAKKGQFFNFSNILLRKQGLFSMKSFEGIYNEYFPSNSFSALDIPLHVTATNLLKGELEYFSSGNLSKALMASSCIPMIFQPVPYNNSIYVDGGVLNNFPIEPLLGKCDVLIGVHVNSIHPVEGNVRMRDVIDRCFHLAMSTTVHEKVSKCQLFIEPPGMSEFSIFDVKKADEIMECGYKHTLSLETDIQELMS